MTNEQIVSVQPMTKKLAEPFYRLCKWEPSAVERLAALEDPEMAERVAKYDEKVARHAELNRHAQKLSDMVHKATKR